MAIANVFDSEGSRWRSWFLLRITLTVVFLLILWYFVVPKVMEYLAPKQEVPVVKVPTWSETLPEAPKKQTYTVNVVPPPNVVGTIQPKGGSK